VPSAFTPRYDQTTQVQNVLEGDGHGSTDDDDDSDEDDDNEPDEDEDEDEDEDNDEGLSSGMRNVTVGGELQTIP
jgi:hypothetical protein